MKALDSFQINSTLIRDCHQTLAQNTTGSNWYGCRDMCEWIEMKQLINSLDKAPPIHLKDLSLPLAYLPNCQGSDQALDK
jgi:hypothetical protein